MTNEAADQIQELLADEWIGVREYETLVQRALAAERRATVQRIRQGLSRLDFFDPYNLGMTRYANAVYALLDDEASR